MDAVNPGLCPRCGAPFAPDDLAPLCGRCVMKENLHVNTGGSPVRSLQIERTRRKLRGFLPILVIVAITSMISSVRDRRPVPAPKRSFLLNAGTQLLRQGKLPEAATEFRRVIKIKPREADAHYLLALRSKGKGSLKQRWRNTALRSLSDPSNRGASQSRRDPCRAR